VHLIVCVTELFSRDGIVKVVVDRSENAETVLLVENT